MADIKTRDVVKGTIKKIDKAAIAADRMRSAYVQTKEKAERTSLISRGARGWKKRNGMCPKQRMVFKGSGKSERLSR